ncbi:uncharacterized protein LOC123526495 isoform X2 [Mercenaria mercenaria]|uniref:uncharacterized protein LOC123526495 isoform X2 n=1 Tax=Mercenaria mercenaria TaxID=6596 RepID=UPI00234F20A7|nr:uncharacterized protein LOC123526495 isoform X2 [Mercenaria mercenaria]
MWKCVETTALMAIVCFTVSQSDPFEVLQNVGGTFDIKHSESQYKSTSTISTLFIPGHDELDSPGTSNIVDRYTCTDYKMTLSIQKSSQPKNVFLNMSLPGSVTRHDQPTCTVNWGDGTTDSVVQFENDTEAVNHGYTDFGIYQVGIDCKSMQGDVGICPERYSECFETSNFFDDVHSKFQTPMVYFSSEPILINSFMKISKSNCTSPNINWRITRVYENNTFAAFTNFTQPNTSVLRLQTGTLTTGFYIVSLEVLFPTISEYEWVEDSFVLRVVDPELNAHISGGEFLNVPRGDELLIYADKSYDPLNTSLSLPPLEATWSFAVFNSTSKTLTVKDLQTFMRNFPHNSLPSNGLIHMVKSGTDFVLKVNTSLFPAKSYGMAMFTLSRGTRMASALQVIQFMDNVLPMTIECVYNCHTGRDRIFYYDKVELDVNFPVGTITTDFSYTWSILVWNTTKLTSQQLATLPPYTTPDSAINLETGLNTASLGIRNGSLVQGYTYKITVTVSSRSHATSVAELIRTVNHVPSDGTCELESGKTNVTSARDWLTFACTSWRKYDDVIPNAPTVDVNPILSFTVRQRTVGALVEEEPILQTRSQTSYVILKVGDPDNNYETELLIQVTDIFNNYNQQALKVIANPAFAVDDVGPHEDGAVIIRSYTEVDYPSDEQQLRDMGKSDMMISLVSAVCSNIHLVDLGTWVPPVPRVLNSDGFVIDLNAEGNKDVGNLDNVISDADNETIDPATLAIQDIDLIYMARIVGFGALLPQNTTGDSAAQTETSSGEIYYMFQAIVQASIPDDFVEIRSVDDLVSGRSQINEMLSALGQNISLDNSELSPDERAYLYTLMQRRLKYNTQDKKQTAREAAHMAIDLAQEVQNQLKLCRICSNQNSSRTDQLIKKGKTSYFVSEMTATATSKFRIDGLNKSLENESSTNIFDTVSVSAFEFPENVFMYDNDGTSSYITSKVLRIDIKSSEQRVTPGFMTFEQRITTPDPVHVLPVVDKEDVSDFMYHKFIYQKSTDDLCMIILPIGRYNFTSYLVYIKFHASPSIIDYDFTFHVERDNNWQICIQPEKMKKHTGLTFLAVSLPGAMRNVAYNLTIVTVGCLTWEEQARKWHTDKCQLEWKPAEDLVSCFCREVTDLVFSNSFFAAPNSIDFSAVLLKFSPLNQAAVLGTLSVLFVGYFVAVVILVSLDKRDALKWGITPLRDNFVSDQHFYILKVYTGMRRGAGTRSRVAFILTGTNGNTGPRELYDGVREEFTTGSIMSFFLATNAHLGDLQHFYIWHDNSGESQAGWYLNQIVIYDIKTCTVHTFVAERWLSIETNIDAHLTSNPSSRPIKFESRFFYQLRERFSQNHMWISILYRPQTSTFTRVQRVSCALAYIFLTMLANAMYFNPEPEYVSPAILQVGPFRFTKQQISISMICALITTPPVMLIVFLFQHTKKRRNSCISCKRCCSCTLFCQKDDPTDDLLRTKLLSSQVPELRGRLCFPYWFVYINWFILVAAILVPAFFILLYSIEWGKQKSEEWLTTFFMSLFESILLVDPVMVICIVLVLSVLIRSNTLDTHLDVEDIVRRYKHTMGHDESELSVSIKILKAIRDDVKSLKSNPRQVTPPLQGQSLALAAERHRHDTILSSFIKDILLNLFLIFIIFSICYANRDDRSYLLHSEIVNTIVKPWKLPQFQAITTPGDLYNWLNMSVIPSLFPEFDANGAPLHWTVRQFTTGYNNLRLGPPRLRQLRTKNNTCIIPYIGSMSCYGKYEILDDEDRNFCLGWSAAPCPSSEAVFNVSSAAWNYISAYDIWGLPTSGVYTTYGGGGYIASFDISRNISISILNELFANLWMDRQTRAVLFEFTLYNAATNIFIYNVFVVEFLQTGGAFTSYSTYPVRVYTHLGSIGTFTLVCEIIFIIYVITLCVKICIRIYKQCFGFFKSFWQVYELVMFTLGLVIIIFYSIRLGLAFETIHNFKKDKKLFVNFAHITLWDQILVSSLAFLLFMATLRMLEVFASSKNVNAIYKVFCECGKDLFWYSMTFLHIFLAFCFLGFLMFGSQLLSYKNIFKSMGTLFVTLAGKSKFAEINEKQPVYAKVFFSFYILTVVFFVLTIFLSLLGISIDNVVHETRQDPREDVIDYVVKYILSLFTKPARQTETRALSPLAESPMREETPQEQSLQSYETTPIPSVCDETEFNVTEDSSEIESYVSEDPEQIITFGNEEPELTINMPSLEVEEPRTLSRFYMYAKPRKSKLRAKRKPKQRRPWMP